ncbi:MAG: hypothetical protein H7317_01605 [Pseudorhodobacter sp.]|nr:hypothetical protein [Pseudorhodobacter sp.]
MAELSLAPQATEWSPGRTIAEGEEAVWAESIANAPIETMSAVSAAQEDLVLGTPDLRVPKADALPDGRAKRHFKALISLWGRMPFAQRRRSNCSHYIAPQ